MFDERMLSKLFVSEGGKVTGDWRKLRREFRIVLFPNTIRVRKWRRMGWAENVARMWRRREIGTEICSGSMNERHQWQNLGIEGSIILNWM
jgi:hypothetical protein